ncbi:MAG: glycerophosphodiester phosphodiesterase [Acutalibacteraceae bacterium]|jgi:glycerophosphoryl diester phosphodiesterase
MKKEFVNYAHRGASEYLPENTLLAFYTGIYMGANGIETDVRKTKDGKLILFHDDTLERVTGESGAVEDYTYKELQNFHVKKNGFYDKIPLFEDFLQHLSHQNLTFAIELKGEGVEEEIAELLRKYDMANKTVVTSFSFEYISKFRLLAPEFPIGWLVREINDDIINSLKSINAEEICPKAEILTAELVDDLHSKGFRVRAWGVADESLMELAFDCGVDGMTVNFPDKLTKLLAKHQG